MTPAQSLQIAEYHARLTLLCGQEVADTVKAQALAAGEDALRWAQTTTLPNGWACWDGVSGRFEQALQEAMAGRDPLGEKPVHHRWRVPLSAEHARQVDDATARAFLAGVPFAASAMADLLHRFIQQPPEPQPDIERLKAALAAISPASTTMLRPRAPRGRRASPVHASPAQAARRLR